MMKGDLLTLIVATTIAVASGANPLGTPSKVAYDGNGSLYVELRDPQATFVLDSAHCASWVYTNQSVTTLSPAAHVFAWKRSLIAFPRSITYVNGDFFSYLPGWATENLDIAGDILVKPTVGSMINTDVTVDSDPALAGGIGIGLGKLVAGRSCCSLIDVLSGTEGAMPFTLLLSDAANTVAGVNYPKGWYSVGLDAFSPSIFIGDAIQWPLYPSTRSGATVTKLLSVQVVKTTKNGAASDDGKIFIPSVPSVPLVPLVPSLVRRREGVNMILNIRDRLTLLPYDQFITLVRQLLTLGTYSISNAGNGIYKVTLNQPISYEKTLSFTLANGQNIVINSLRLFDGQDGTFAGYKLGEMPTNQKAELSPYGPDAVYLGNGFVADYALEHSLSCPVSLRLRQYGFN